MASCFDKKMGWGPGVRFPRPPDRLSDRMTDRQTDLTTVAVRVSVGKRQGELATRSGSKTSICPAGTSYILGSEVARHGPGGR